MFSELCGEISFAVILNFVVSHEHLGRAAIIKAAVLIAAEIFAQSEEPCPVPKAVRKKELDTQNSIRYFCCNDSAKQQRTTAWHTIFRAAIIITGIIFMAFCPGCAEPQQQTNKSI
jgi:hypothetical protein